MRNLIAAILTLSLATPALAAHKKAAPKPAKVKKLAKATKSHKAGKKHTKTAKTRKAKGAKHAQLVNPQDRQLMKPRWL